MKKEINDVSELVFVLDESGSMSGKEEDVIGGFNSNIKKQRGKDYKTLVTTVMFSDDAKTIHDRVDIEEISNLTEEDYLPNGCTALYDAVAETIKHISYIQKYVENKPKRTLFIIMTDGLENASKKYNHSQVKTLIERQKEAGWNFLFLGANIDAEKVADEIGISKEWASTYNIKKSRKAYDCTGAIANMALEPTISIDKTRLNMKSNEDWKNEIK